MPGARKAVRAHGSSSPSLSWEWERAVRNVRAADFKVMKLGDGSWIVVKCWAWSGR